MKISCSKAKPKAEFSGGCHQVCHIRQISLSGMKRGGILYGVGMVKRVNYETKNNVMLYGVGNACMWGWQEGCESMQLVPSNGVLFIIIIKINRIFMIIYTNLINKL